MIGTGMFGNAATVILASGFSGQTELGILPDSVLSLVVLAEEVSLVRANESVSFHLAAKSADRVRSDTALYRWIADTSPSVITTPDYFLRGTEAGTFQLLKKVVAHDKHPELTYMRCPIKYVPSTSARSLKPELWLRTVVLHNGETVTPYIDQAVRVGV